MTADHTLPHHAAAMNLTWRIEGTGRFEGQSDAASVSRYFLVACSVRRAVNASSKEQWGSGTFLTLITASLRHWPRFYPALS